MTQISREKIVNEYFSWLCDIIHADRFKRAGSYSMLLSTLYNREFTWSPEYISDADRAGDGMELRWRFACETGRERLHEYVKECLAGPCNLLEMLVALSSRCEETIMDDPRIGNRPAQWFLGMLRSLGLSGFTDDRFDRHKIDRILSVFESRTYRSNGEGGLFTIRNCSEDMRCLTIWKQLCLYLDSIA